MSTVIILAAILAAIVVNVITGIYIFNSLKRLEITASELLLRLTDVSSKNNNSNSITKEDLRFMENRVDTIRWLLEKQGKES